MVSKIKDNAGLNVIVIPNAEISFRHGLHYSAKGDVDFLTELSCLYNLKIAGIVNEKDSPFHSTLLPLSILELSHIEKESIKPKYKIYSDVFFRFLSVVNTRSFFYLYFPFSPLIIILPLIILFRRPYALYLRGDWQRKGWVMAIVSKFFLKKAKFVLCTGPLLLKELNALNIKSEMVVPMTNILKNSFVKKNNYKIHSLGRLLFVGRLTFDKGILELVDALNILNKQGVNFEMHFVGPLDDNMKYIFEENLVKYNLASHIILHGQVTDNEQLSFHYANADLFIFPSHHEGFPRVVYEAMAHSLPIVATQLPYIEVLLQKGDEILTVPVNNAYELANAISRGLKNEKLREYLGNAGNNIFKELMSLLKSESHSQQVHRYIKLL